MQRRRSKILIGLALALGAPVGGRTFADSPASSIAASTAAVLSVHAAVLDVHAFRPVEGPKSGPEVYYQVVESPDGPVLRGSYHPGMQSVTMGIRVPEGLGHRVGLVRWHWRARAFPDHGDECRDGRGDSAASVSLAFKRGWKWYILKYVWSSASPLGAVCDQKRTPLLARDAAARGGGRARRVHPALRGRRPARRGPRPRRDRRDDGRRPDAQRERSRLEGLRAAVLKRRVGCFSAAVPGATRIAPLPPALSLGPCRRSDAGARGARALREG